MLKPLIAFDYWGYPIYLIMVLIGVWCAFYSLIVKEKTLNIVMEIREKVRWSFFLGLLGGIAFSNISNRLLFLENGAAGGFNFYGGLFGFFIVSIGALSACHLNVKFWINQIIPSVLIFHGFGRIGCSLVGCCYGKTVALYGLVFDFPAREIEALGLFIMYYFFEKKILEHRVFWYFLCYSILRFCLEFERGDERGSLFRLPLSPAQVISIIIWIGLFTWWTASGKKQRI